MDPRITSKVNDLVSADAEARAKAVEREENAKREHQKRVQESIPAAQKFVEDILIDKIAKAMHRGEHSVDIGYWERTPEGDLIPPEAIAKVAQSIEGVRVISTFIPERTDHFNSDEVMETIPAHSSYSVKW